MTKGYCLVPGCKNTTEVLSAFSMPNSSKNKERRDKWIKILKLPTLDHYSRTVCEIHFDESQFTSHHHVRLKPGAIPRPFIIKQDITIDCDRVNKVLSQSSSDPLKIPYLMQPEIISTIPTLTKYPRVNNERLSESTSSSQLNEINPLSNGSPPSKSIPQPGCALCKNQSGLRSEHWEYDETVGKFEDLKKFLCKILKLEFKRYKDFPFCKKCTTRLEELHTMYVELRMLQLKFQRLTDKVKKDFTRTFLSSHSTISKQTHDVFGAKVVNAIIQKWNRTEGLQTITGRLENSSTPPQIPTAIPLQIPNQILQATPPPIPNQLRTITVPISFVIRPPKKSTATVGVNTEIQFNVDNIRERKSSNEFEDSTQESSDEFEDSTQDSVELFEENDSAVAELHRKPFKCLSEEGLENAQVNSAESSNQTKNMFKDNTSVEAPFFIEQSEEEDRVSKTRTEEMNEESFTENPTLVIRNEKQIVVKEKRVSRKPKQIRKARTCPVCFKYLKGSAGVANHMLIHTGERPHECPDCGKRFVQIAHLYTHKQNVHGYDNKNSEFDRNNYFESKNRFYNCHLCSHFFNKTRYLRHIKDYHVNREIMDGETIWFYYCDYQNCKKSFSSQKNLRIHFLEDHHQNDPELLNVCDVCDRVFCLKENLEVHKTSHSAGVESVDTVYPCSYCHTVFTTEGELNDHIPRHKIEFKLSQFSHQCELCGEGFLYPMSLYHHKKSTECQNSKRKRGSLKKMPIVKRKKRPIVKRKKMPIVKSKNIKNNLSTCEFCGKTGITCNIERHKFIHTHPEGFKCNICEHVAKNPALLKRHFIGLHSRANGEHVCEICQRSFVDNRMLVIHNIRHHPENFLQGKVHCISCFQLFDTQESMTVHFEEEHPEKICRMNDCGKIFARKDQLIKHTRVHTGERPHQCSFCNESFKCVTILQRHVERRHTKHRNFFCKLCVTNPGFFERREFYKHASNSHPELNPMEIIKTNYVSRKVVYALPSAKRKNVSRINLSHNKIENE